MAEFKGFFKQVDNRNYNTWCRWTNRLDTYGCGCEHDCKYCYAKSLLSFRGLWRPTAPAVANISMIDERLKRLEPGTVIRMGGMTDCFQPLETTQRVAYETIKLCNRYGLHYLIVTKSHIIAEPEYLEILDRKLAHIQITVTSTDDELCRTYENASPPSLRIQAIETLQKCGFDVSVRLSPFIPQFVDIDKINAIRCDKILIEFLKVNSSIKKCFDIDYSEYTLKYGGYEHLPFRRKKELVDMITGFEQVSVGEYVWAHHEYFREYVNYNPRDCCNLRIEEGVNEAMNNDLVAREESGVQNSERLMMIESRIRDNMNRAAESLINVGRCLNQAKDEKLVPHGRWQAWVQKHTGLSVRGAQRVMQVAREIPNTSTLSHLEFSKVQALLALPAPERESFADEVGADEMSVRELRAAVDARLAAERDKDAEHLMRVELERENAELARQLEEAQNGGVAQAEIERLQAEKEEAEEDAIEQANAAAKARNELLALQRQVARGDVGGISSSGDVLTDKELYDIASGFVGRVAVLPHMGTQLATCDHNTRAAYRASVEMVMDWCERAMRAIDTITGEVIVSE